MIDFESKNRVLSVQGGFNFRDLGGLRTQDGKAVKKDLLFRTDELSNLNSSDLNLLTQLSVKTVVDFRTDQERALSIDRIPSSCKQEIHLDIVAANMNAFMKQIQDGRTDFKDLLMNFYKELALGNNAITQLTRFFEILQNPNNNAVIYHCTAGKDRTGVATALILEALNVSSDDILSDYMLSNFFLKEKYASYIEQNPKLSDLFLVQEDYLHNALDAIASEYDSVNNYLSDVLKVDIDLMKNLYTE
jgi:protein-tyrosine phosphatase